MDKEGKNINTLPVGIHTTHIDGDEEYKGHERSAKEHGDLPTSEGSLDSNREINWLESGNSSETSTHTSPAKATNSGQKEQIVQDVTHLKLEGLQGNISQQQRQGGYEILEEEEDTGDGASLLGTDGCLTVHHDGASNSSDAISPVSDSGQTLSSVPYSSSKTSPYDSSSKTSPYDSSTTNDSSPGDAPNMTELHIPSTQLGVDARKRTTAITALSNAEATGVVATGEGSPDRLPLHGTVTREGEMVSFVADDLIEKIRQSASSPSTSPANSLKDNSPTTPSISSSSSRFSMRSSSVGSISAIPPVDPVALMDLERHCKRVADSMDLMFGHLAGTLHNMSAITVGHTQTYRDAVEKAGITVDQSVRSMYALMAKCEELQKTMHTTRELAKQVRSIKRQLDELENVCK